MQVVVLKPLMEKYGVEAAFATTLQVGIIGARWRFGLRSRCRQSQELATPGFLH
jgi:hypothetical protein